ncbi:hypothetical protein ACE7GA_21855 [Roseomonas sp. CCTCC AB2023176]|uniref:hypothetical protein n=1 Tax=Roseomonas sp. CCTCC AB2023176 TaxID=3342640 RepID=UPI0035DF581F
MTSDAVRREVAADSAALATAQATASERQFAIFRDAAALRRAMQRPRALLVARHGGPSRIADLAATLGGEMQVDILTLDDGPGTPALPAAARTALLAGRHDLLLLGSEDLAVLGGAAPGTTLRAVDAAPMPPAGPVPLDRAIRLTGFDLLTTGDPATQAAWRRALPGIAWFLPREGRNTLAPTVPGRCAAWSSRAASMPGWIRSAGSSNRSGRLSRPRVPGALPWGIRRPRTSSPSAWSWRGRTEIRWPARTSPSISPPAKRRRP